MEQVDHRRLRAVKGLLVQFDPTDGIAQRCHRARFGSGGSPGPQQPLNHRQQEVATPKRGFQQALGVQWPVRRVAQNIEDKLNDFLAGEDGPPRACFRMAR